MDYLTFYVSLLGKSGGVILLQSRIVCVAEWRRQTNCDDSAYLVIPLEAYGTQSVLGG
jgi:hypothetical protein